VGRSMSFLEGDPAAYIEIQLGNVPGRAMQFVSGTNEAITSSEFRDISSLNTPTGTNPFPLAAESWEIVSINAADTSAGTGARTVTLITMDANYVIQAPTSVTLNGGTATISGTHFRIIAAFVTTAGSGRVNAGDLTIRVAGGGTNRAVMMADVGTAQIGALTVPAGKTARLQYFSIMTPKGNDVLIRSRISNATVTDGAEISGGNLSVYQQINSTDVLAPLGLVEFTDFRLQAKSAINNNIQSSFQADFLITDNPT